MPKNTKPKKKVIIKAINDWNRITASDLEDDCLLILSNGQILRFIGQVDIRTNQEYLFKILFTPFASVTWTQMNPEKIDTLEVKTLIK